MRILVTGGAGFIGSHLVDRLLESGHEVRILDSLEEQVHGGSLPDYLNDGAELVRGDVRDHDAVDAALEGVDKLVHLAALVGVGQSMYEIERYTSVNAVGAAVVLEEAVKRRDVLQKVVVASSMSIYGEGLYRCPKEGTVIDRAQPRPDEQLAERDWELRCPSCGEHLDPLPTPEDKPLQPNSIYAVNKRDHEEMFIAWGRAYKVPVTALRFFNVYGTRQALSNPYTGVAAIFSSRLMNDRAPVVFEDGEQTRDFIHVTDIARGIELALEPGKADFVPVNLGAERPVSVKEIGEILARELGKDIRPDVRNEFRSGDIRHCTADISRARELLGFEPQVRFEDGMHELVEWLLTQEAEDRVDDAHAALVQRGLAT
jgi:dTDP-L-rhamnose 4-epimerase